MHDAAAIAYLLMPEAFTVVRGSARVVDEGIAVGQLAIDRKGYQYSLEYWRDRPTSTGATMAVQADSVRQAFVDTIIQHHII
jgi:inosine-uridine nucleoside N-ribohydrolase